MSNTIRIMNNIKYLIIILWLSNFINQLHCSIHKNPVCNCYENKNDREINVTNIVQCVNIYNSGTINILGGQLIGDWIYNYGTINIDSGLIKTMVGYMLNTGTILMPNITLKSKDTGGTIVSNTILIQNNALTAEFGIKVFNSIIIIGGLFNPFLIGDYFVWETGMIELDLSRLNKIPKQIVLIQYLYPYPSVKIMLNNVLVKTNLKHINATIEITTSNVVINLEQFY